KNVRLSLQTLDLLSFPQDGIKVFLNRSNTNGGIKSGEIERALETKIRFDLPSDRAVPLGVNRGNPVVLGATRSDFAKAIRHLLVQLLSEGKTSRRAKRRLFAKAKA